MGQIVFNEAQIRSITQGTTQIKEVWVGAVKIWPTSSTPSDTPEDGQSNYLFDVSPVTVSKFTSGATGTVTNTTLIKFNADGTMEFDPGTTVQKSGQNITWARWNSNVSALVNPRIDFNLAGITPGYNDIQVSTDLGSTWATLQQGAVGGTGRYSLSNGVWIRLAVSSTNSSSKTVPNILVQFWNNGVQIPPVDANSGAIDLTLTSGVLVASNPFVANFGNLTSEVTVPAGQQATAYCRIFGPNYPDAVYRGKIELVLFGGETASYYNWVVPGQTAPAGTYTVRLEGWENLEPLSPATQPTNGYALPSDGEFYFEVVKVEAGATFRTGDGTVNIIKDGNLLTPVSTGSVTLKARSQGAPGGE